MSHEVNIDPSHLKKCMFFSHRVHFDLHLNFISFSDVYLDYKVSANRLTCLPADLLKTRN